MKKTIELSTEENQFYSKELLKQTCSDLHICAKVRNYLLAILNECEIRGIHPLSLDVKNVVCPLLRRKYKTFFGESDRTIRKTFEEEISRIIKKYPYIFKDNFKYQKIPTTKKFIILVLSKCYL